MTDLGMQTPALPAGLSPQKLRELGTEYGTPLVVYDLTTVQHNAARVAAAFAEALPCPFRAQFAVKSCYLPQVLREVQVAGWGMEVMSGFELDRVLASGVDGAEMILTGLGWDIPTCERAVEAGVRRFVVDSEADVRRLAAAADRAQRQVEVLVRANLADAVPGTFLDPGAKLGHTTGQLPAFLALVTSTPALRLVGLHVHQFNRLTDLDLFERICRATADLVRFLRAQGLAITELDLGGGLASLTKLAVHGVSVEQFAALAAAHLREMGELQEVSIESGRAVVGDAAAAVGRVTAVKASGGHTSVIVDVPTNTLVPIPNATYPPVLLAPDATGRPLMRCSLSDGTGSPVWLACDVVMPRPQEGDLVALTEAGAYTTVFTELWAAALPTVVVLHLDGSRSVRSGSATTEATWKAWHGEASWRNQAYSDGSNPFGRQV
jgi:diaminopimelate decarboxylase